MPCSALQCHAVPCSAVQCCAVLCHPLQCRAACHAVQSPCSATPCHAMPCSAVPCGVMSSEGAVQLGAVRCSLMQPSLMQRSGEQCSLTGPAVLQRGAALCAWCRAVGAVPCGAVQRRTPARCRAVPWQLQDSWLSPCCCLPSAQGRPCRRAPPAHAPGGGQLRGSPHATALSRLCRHQQEPAPHTTAGALPVHPEGGDPGHGGPWGGPACAIAPSPRAPGCGDTRCGIRGPMLLCPPFPTQPGAPRGCVCASAPSAACLGAAGRCLTLPSLGTHPAPCDWDGAPPAGTRTWLRGLARADVTQLSWQHRWHAA